MQKECQNCGRWILSFSAKCPYCSNVPPTGGTALSVVPQANDNWVEDKKPDGTTYRTVVTRADVPPREPNLMYLAYRLRDMVRGEGTHGIGVDVLAEGTPWVYGRQSAARGGGI